MNDNNFLVDLSEQYSIPRYLISTLDVSGYSNLVALRQVLKRSHVELKETLQKFGEYILSDDFEHPEFKAEFIVDCSKFLISKTHFIIPPGHVDFLIGILEDESQLEEPEPEPEVSSPRPNQSKNVVVRKRRIETTSDVNAEHQQVHEHSYSENQRSNKVMKLDNDDNLIEFDAEEGSDQLPYKGKLPSEEAVSFFTDGNKRRLINLIRKCWPPELEAPEYFVLEEVNCKCWSIQCSLCEGVLKIFLITNGGYLRFNKSNFQRHLQRHSQNMTHLSDVEVLENTE